MTGKKKKIKRTGASKRSKTGKKSSRDRWNTFLQQNKRGLGQGNVPDPEPDEDDETGSLELFQVGNVGS
jgi:hypothetical protein